MKLKLDVNLGRQGKAYLAVHGHDVDTTGEEGLNQAADSAMGFAGLDRSLDTLAASLDDLDPAGGLWIVEPRRVRKYLPH